MDKAKKEALQELLRLLADNPDLADRITITIAAWEGRRPPKCKKRSCAPVNAKAPENRKSPLDRTVKSCEGAFIVWEVLV